MGAELKFNGMTTMLIKAWATYNFEVEDLHTYVAGGVRVHNDSGNLGANGNSIDGAIDRLFGGRDDDGSLRDRLTDLGTASLHAVGYVVSGIVGAANDNSLSDIAA